MLFLFKYIDDLIGKGIEASVLLKLMLYASATNVSMALPLAVLLSSIMTFGSLGEHYELVAIKSAGISLQRAMMPLLGVVVMLSVAAFIFSDYMLPVINLKFNSLLYDVRNQKAAFLIDEGVFNNSIAGYSIRVKKKGSDGQTLKDIMIYDHTTTDNINVLFAKEGKMLRSANDKYLILKLKDGIRYEESHGDKGVYNPRENLSRVRFKQTEQQFDLSAFKLQRTDENLFKANDAMLNIKQLRYYRDSIKNEIDSNFASVYRSLIPYYTYNTSNSETGITNDQILEKNMLHILPEKDRKSVIQHAIDQVHMILLELSSKKAINSDYVARSKGYITQLNKKFTLSASCIVLFFVGAPLGAIIRKGGLGLPLVFAILWFLFYHIISTIGEKSFKEGSLSPLLGLWAAIFILTPVGVFLTYKATTDSVLLDLDTYTQFFKKLFTKKE